MLLYSQRDPRWRALLLGSSGLNMGQAGCLVTSIAMLSTYFKPDKTPAEIVTSSKFTMQGLLIWNSLQLGGFKFYRRAYTREDAEIRRHLADNHLAVVLQTRNGTHWVVATGRDWFGGLYKIADPLVGDRATLARYQNSLTGAAYFKRV